MKKLLLLCLLAAFAACGPLALVAADTKPAPAEKEKTPRRTRDWIPFHGTIDSVDKSAKSITVGERTFHALTSTKYKIRKTGKSAGFEDAKVGEEVGGTYRKTASGKLELLSLGLGPKPEDEVKKEVKDEVKKEIKKAPVK